jgi:hypothetical protein
MMSFKQLIEEFISPYQQKWLGEKEQMGSPHQKTKVANDPARCTFHQLLVLAEMLGRSPYDIMEEYGLGDEGLSEREKQVVEQFLKGWVPEPKTNGHLAEDITGISS